ncbi:lipoprotein [Wenyingzhuangia aestuarii]|uniref:lipoprotein n=1 Tax=Wenyingzhuangia aestuarii TaxID=1647582 RepID=UPI00143991D3|nr:hypothetical protein [Wenyingzhuangia aestuarii]NJB81903.1 hypothetical protein [Wenyingzhuangia aestuarii]
MKKSLSYLVLIVLLSACAKKINPVTAYSELTVSAVQKEKLPIVELALDKPLKAELKLEDNVMANDSILSYYHEYTYTPNETKNYTVEIFSLCNCFGFKKYIFNPTIKVVDKNHQEIKQVLETQSYDYQKGPISLNKKWRFTGVKNQPITIVVFSDNYALEKPIHQFKATSTSFASGMIIPIVAPIKLKATLVGKYYIELSQNTTANKH